VTQYLERNAIDAVLAFVSTLKSGSEIVFTVAPPDDELDGDGVNAIIHSAGRTAAFGEPWKSRLRPSDVIEQLTQLGFSDVFHLTPQLAHRLYFSASGDDAFKSPTWEQLIAAVV
jgi:O-methyltransferase involved in polyketide biosynthesis